MLESCDGIAEFDIEFPQVPVDGWVSTVFTTLEGSSAALKLVFSPASFLALAETFGSVLALATS